MDSSVLLEFSAVQKRTTLNDYDKKFLANCLTRLLDGDDLTEKQIELLHRMSPEHRFPVKERVQRVGYTLIDNCTGRKVNL
jgi:hypothetical protein